MSQANYEIIARMYSAWNSGDMDALADMFDAEVEVRPALSTFLASYVYRGHDGVADGIRSSGKLTTTIRFAQGWQGL